MALKGGEKPKWDPRLEAFMKLLLDKNGVRRRSAAEEGRRAVEFFRGVDFVKWVQKHQRMLESKMPELLETTEEKFPNLRSAEGVVDVAKLALYLGQRLIHGHFICKAQNAATPVVGDKPVKWPKKLSITQYQFFEENGFFVILYEGSRMYRNIALGVVIFVVLLICMFPAWPLAVKIGVWYCSVVLMTSILGLSVLRLITFILLWFFGCDFWILPNIFNEDAGFVDSFIPLYTFEYRNDNWFMLICRAFCCILSVAGIYQLGQTHSISEINQFARQQFIDVIDWGTQKLAPPPDVQPFVGPDDPLRARDLIGRGGARLPRAASAEERRAAKEKQLEEDGAYDVIEDYSCLQKCGFNTFDELLDDCIDDCQCMEELLTTPCFKRCNDATQHVLYEGKVKACEEKDDDEEEVRIIEDEDDDDEVHIIEDEDDKEEEQSFNDEL